MRLLRVMVTLLLIAGLTTTYVVQTEHKASQAYVRRLGLELTGTVVGVAIAPNEHDRGVLHLRVSTINQPTLEPREHQAFFTAC